MKNQIKHVLNQLKNYNPEKIILFGSYAYGKPSPNSDIDIALIKKTNKPFHDRLKEARMFLRTTTPVDIFVFTPDELNKKKDTNPLIKEIVTRGKVLHG